MTLNDLQIPVDNIALQCYTTICAERHPHTIKQSSTLTQRPRLLVFIVGKEICAGHVDPCVAVRVLRDKGGGRTAAVFLSEPL